MKIQNIVIVVLLLSLVSCGSKRKATQISRSNPRPTQTLESTSRTVVYTQTVEEYIDVYAPIAMRQMQGYGIPASIILAQGILESGSGKGELVLKANNHFGIKCHNGWTGGRVYHDDDARGECFRKYDNPESSYIDHSEFLTSGSRYDFLFNLKKDDYKGWAKGLRKAGYATDRRYPEKLISLIERYDLDRYDRMMLGKKTRSNAKPSSVKNPIVQEHIVRKGDTLYSISKRYQMSVDELKRKNGLRDNTIRVGQVLYLN